MKLIKLEILNLASLDNPNGETINFEEGVLKDCTIFSIVGSTGSGKSTILDAICLALYGRTPRYPRKKNERGGKIEIYGESDSEKNKRLATTDCRNILTRGKNDGYSKLTFLANDKYLYRTEWHIHFNRTRYNDAVTNLYRMKPQSDGSYIEEELDWESITQIVGLDYEQFLRTVLLAQGSFANFLTADENDRYLLLEKLVGCEDLYSAISCEIKTRRDAAKKHYDEISASVASIQQNILSDADLNILIEEINRLETAQKALDAALRQIETELKWYAEEKLKSEDIAKYKADDEKATAALKEIEEDVKLLTRYDAIQPALKLLHDIKILEEEIKSNNETILSKQQEEKEQKTNKEVKEIDLSTLKNNEKTAKDEQEKFAPIIAEARILKGQIATLENVVSETMNIHANAQSEKTKAENNLSKNQTDIATNKKAIDEANAQQTAITEQISQQLNLLSQAIVTAKENLKNERIKNEGIDADLLLQNKKIADQKFTYAKEAKLHAEQHESINTEKREKEKAKQQLEEDNRKLTEQLNALTIDVLEKQYNTTRDAYTLITSENWAQHRTQLKANEECPLCGATHHPYCEETTKVEAVAHSLQEQCLLIEKELNTQKKHKIEWQTQKSSNEGKLSALVEQLKKLDNDLKETNAQWEKLLVSFPEIQSYSILNKSEIEAIIPQLENKQKIAEETLLAYNNTQKEIDRLQKIKDKADKALLDYKTASDKQLQEIQHEINQLREEEVRLTTATPMLEKQLQDKTKELETIGEQFKKQQGELNSLKLQLKDKLQNKDPETFELELKNKVEQAEIAVKNKEKEIQRITESLKTIEGELATLQNKLSQAQNKLTETNSTLCDWLNLYNLNNSAITLDDVFAIYNSNYNWEAIRKNKEELQNKKTSVATLLIKAQEEYNKHLETKPEKSQDELLQEQETLKGQNYNDQLVEQRAKKKNHDDAQRALGAKSDELKLASDTNTNWTTIYDAIGSDGKTLRKIAQCYTLSFLVEYANVEIRRFNSRYELIHVKNSLGIKIIDHDRADDIRDTTSLSGGETFIISLGLALGLSTLSSRNVSFDNLFIDEGFGTLDPDALATVIDSLAMLQSSQGKKVCVISHTDTMSERITTQIRVIKNGSGSSRIEIHS